MRVVREQIDPRLTAALFANDRSPVDAVLGLVDNAIDSRVPERPLEADLSIRPSTITLTVVNGEGVGPRDLERESLRWGGSRKRAGERIGHYGQGGRTAIAQLGERFSLVAGKAGDDRAYAFSDHAYRDRSRLRTYELHGRAKPVDVALGYLRIEIGALNRNPDPRRLRQRLADVYRPLLESGEVRMRLVRSVVEPVPWQLAERHGFAVRAGGRTVRGWSGLLPDPPLGVEPGVRLSHLGRLIGAPEWFGHAGPASHPALERLVGEVEPPHVPVTMNKSDVDRGSDAWVAVEQRLHRLLAPIVGRLTSESGTAASPQALRTAEQVRRILARAPAGRGRSRSSDRRGRDRRPRPADAQRDGGGGRGAPRGDQLAACALRGAPGRPLVSARDRLARGVCHGRRRRRCPSSSAA